MSSTIEVSPIRMLMVEDNPDAVVLFRRMLMPAQASDVSIEYATTLAAALTQLERSVYDVVLLDLSLPDSSGLETFQEVRRVSDAAIVILTGEDDEEIAVTAVREGADDYLLKSDINGGLLGRRVRYAVERNRQKTMQIGNPARKGRIVVFTGAKGGVGTTTLVLNAAASLTAAGKSVLALELRSDAGAFGAQLRMAPNLSLSNSLSGAIPVRDSNVEACIVPLSSGMRVIFGPQRPEEFLEIQPEPVAAVLKLLSRKAEIVLVDLGSCPLSTATAVLKLADFVTLVVERDTTCLRTAMLKTAWMRSINALRDAAFGVVVVSRVPFSESATATEIKSQLQCELVGSIPPASEHLAANRTGNPIVVAMPDLAVSVSYTQTALKFKTAVAEFQPV